MKIKIFLLASIGMFPLLCKCQRNIVRIEKRTCHRVDKIEGAKLYIHLRTDSGNIVSDFDYGLEHFIDLPDSIKLQIISQLLHFKNDSTLCCLKVVDRSFNGFEGCRGHPDSVERYTIQIDALFMINRLCWPHMMELFSCVPVLYDNEKKECLNKNHSKIKLVFDKYQQWYELSVSRGRIGRYFPFNDGRYVWYGGRKSVVSKEE